MPLQTYDEYTDFMNKVVSHLKVDAGFKAYSEFMGGGTICIIVPVGSYNLYWGTANEFWGADVYRGDEFLDGESVEIPMPVDCNDPSEVALQIIMASMKYEESHR